MLTVIDANYRSSTIKQKLREAVQKCGTNIYMSDIPQHGR
jgi:hypothetical protein